MGVTVHPLSDALGAEIGASTSVGRWTMEPSRRSTMRGWNISSC